MSPRLLTLLLLAASCAPAAQTSQTSLPDDGGDPIAIGGKEGSAGNDATSAGAAYPIIAPDELDRLVSEFEHDHAYDVFYIGRGTPRKVGTGRLVFRKTVSGEPGDYAVLIRANLKSSAGDDISFEDSQFFESRAPYRLLFGTTKGQFPGAEWGQEQFVNSATGSSRVFRDSDGELTTETGPPNDDSLAPHLAIFAPTEGLKAGLTQMFRIYRWKTKTHQNAPLRVERVEQRKLRDQLVTLVHYDNEAANGPYVVIDGKVIARWTFSNLFEFRLASGAPTPTTAQ